MHPDIMMAINQFYEDRLECGLKNPDLDRVHRLGSSVIQDNHHIAWVKMPKSPEFKEQKIGTSFTNLQEVEAIECLCQQFEQTWVSQVEQGQLRKEVGIITFYGSQLRLIEQKINPARFPSLHIRTGKVDRFQGMEKQIIIVSMVRNNDRRDIGFAKSPERVNVAFSRAQELLVIVGCHSLFTQSPIYSNVSDVVRLNGDLIDVSALI
jgi:superfamily I DNA and/or RNA helicase